jgi:hypothetical protein
MEYLTNLFMYQTKKIHNDALESCVDFPRTETLLQDKPACFVELFALTPNKYDQIKENVTSDPELISLRAVSDVCMVLCTLKEIHDTLHLDQFDMIQLTRSGVVLLRIVNTSRSVNRSATIEINQYKRKIQQLLHPQDKGQSWWPIITTSSIAGLTFAIFQHFLTKQ